MSETRPTNSSRYDSLPREQLVSLVEDLSREVEKLQTHIANANRKQFGRKSETRKESTQEALFTFEEQAPQTVEVEVKEHKREIKRGRKPLSPDLPRRRIEYVPDEKTCSCCGSELVRIGEEVTEEADYIPARIEVIQHVKVQCACKVCEGAGVKIGKIPVGTLPLEGSRPGAGLLTQIILAKYVDHTPLYRQEQIFLRSGLEVSRRRMCDWIAALVDTLLVGLWRALKAETLSCSYVQADETWIKVRDLEELAKTGDLATGYFWAVHGPPNLAFFEYHDTRASEAAKQVLEGLRGVVQTDLYAGYNIVLLPDKVLRLACMAHIRRKFIEARATAAAQCDPIIKQIAKLYALESHWVKLQPTERFEKRQKHSKHEFEKLHSMIVDLSNKMLPKHALQEALKYALKQWIEMSRYLEDGRFNIDNNPIERQIRPVALGRKNYLFAGSHDGARRAAILYSLLATCKLNDVNPRQWLTDILKKLPGHPASRISELLPHRWKVAQN